LKNLAILGSTGSIGQSALDVVRAHPDKLRVVSLAAGGNAEAMRRQVAEFSPRVVAMATADALQAAMAGHHAECALSGAAGLVAVATHPDVDIVICASAGTAALEAMLKAIAAKKTIALANKEVLVMAGALVTQAARAHGVAILPVDSEHNAIHQCLHGRSRAEVRRVILTASGGPFRQMPAAGLAEVTPAAALQHPTWRMGRKITIDSATLMNKGLEVIEAHWLFDLPASRIDVVIHPQSIVHSMVELLDGSIIAQLGGADMKLPIQYACSYPDRWEAPVARLDLTTAPPLEFHAPDVQRFPCLALAYRALEAGPSHAVILNAANEVAVASYLNGQIPFLAIPRVIEQSLDAHTAVSVNTLDEVLDLDGWARRYSKDLLRGLESRV
jgi:1-deoxy-D-xylulose-5-phosphate reductoisomerase